MPLRKDDDVLIVVLSLGELGRISRRFEEQGYLRLGNGGVQGLNDAFPLLCYSQAKSAIMLVHKKQVPDKNGNVV